MKVIRTLVVLGAIASMTAPLHAQSVWDPATVKLTTSKLSEGVFAVIAEASLEDPAENAKPTSGGFVVGDRGILVIESMLTPSLAAQMLSLIKTEEPNKPILYVVNTSYHGDHSYGNYLFPATAAVIQHQGTVDYISEHFEADREWMIETFGQDRGMEDVAPRAADIIVDERLVIDLGGRRVEILHMGFGQTPGDLLVWLPEAHVMWTGNAILGPGPALPWLLDGRHDDVLKFVKRVRDFLPDDAIIVPGHHRPMQKSDIDFFVEYLETLHTEVAEAVQKGWSPERTVAEVTMPEFRGYNIFDWVHSQINVPATYEDLTQ